MEIRIPSSRRKATISVDEDTASAIRRIASSEGRSRKLNEVVSDMVRAYVASAHADWEIVDGAAAPATSARTRKR